MLPKGLVSLLALLCFLGLLAQSPPGFNELARQATSAREGNDVRRATELYRQALALNPKWEEGWWFLGSIYYDADRYPDGRDALRHVVELDPKAAPAWGLLGLCQFQTADYSESLASIERSLDSSGLDPKLEAVLRFHRALLLAHAGRFEAALTGYAWFTRRGVQNPQLTTAIGLSTLRSPKVLSEITPDQQSLYTAAGNAASDLFSGDSASARQGFARLALKYPDARGVHYAYGTFLLASDPQEAERQFELELKNTPDSGAANAMLAWMRLRQDDTAGAFPFAQQAVALEPALPLAQYVYGRSQAERGDMKGAIVHLEQAVKANPRNLEMHVWLAHAYARAARPLDARREREVAIALSREEQPLADP